MRRRRAAWSLAAGMGAMLWAAWRRAPLYALRGKGVLITGGSRGLGLELARQFARRGARLALAARDPDELARAAAELGPSVVCLPCDVRDKEAVRQAVAEATAQLGAIDVLVNNAGIIQVGPLEEMRLPDFEEAMATHFFGPLYATLAVLPQMRGRREGRIVNISSIGGKISVPHLLPYSASKFALVGLSEGLRSALADEGIAVTTVCPGLMRTGSAQNADFKGQHRAEYTLFALPDALPPFSISAERAAAEIVKACRRGTPELVLSLPAKLAVLFHGIAPSLFARVMRAVNRALPGPGGIGASSRKGYQSETSLTRSFLTGLSRRAALRNNEGLAT